MRLFELSFPGRVSGYYLLGSHAEQSAVGSSDLDLELIFRGELAPDEGERAEELAQSCTLLCASELDIEVKDERQLAGGVWPNFKLSAKLIYGEDIRERLPLLPLIDWTRDRMHSSYWRLIHLFHRPLPLRQPLHYPEPEAEFFGYTNRPVQLPDGREVPSTRDLIRVTSWAATAILAWKAGRYVAGKRDCPRLYRECFPNEEGVALLEDIFEYCRDRWHYLLPEEPGERRRLRAICARTLTFEKHFLTVYKDFLLSELRGPAAIGRELALEMLARLPLEDEEVSRAMR